MISIIISAYKNDKYLIEALNSVVDSAKQKEYEILLGVDNCSETMEGIIKNYDSLPEQLKIFYFPKVGTYVIRNSLAEIASFDKLIFFDSDDLMSNTTVENSLKCLDTYDLGKFKYQIFHNNFDETKKSTYQKSQTYHFGCFTIRKETFLEMNGFEPWVCAADGEFMWRVESNNYKIYGIDDIGFYYRRHTNNLTIAGPTNMNSPLRKHYHNIKNNKIKSNQKGKLSKLNSIQFIKINEDNLQSYESELNKLNIINPYNFEKDFHLTKQKKEDVLNKVLKINNVEEPTINNIEEPTNSNMIHPHDKIQKTLERRKTNIDYEKVNQIFGSPINGGKINKDLNRPINTRSNADVIRKLMNKSRNR